MSRSNKINRKINHKEQLRYIRVPCGDFLLKPNRDLLEQVTVKARQTQLDAASERSINLYAKV